MVAVVQSRSRGHVYSLAFSPDGKWLACGDGNEVQLYSTGRLQQPAILKGHKKTTFCVAFSKNSTLLASVGMDGSVIVWNVGTDEPREHARLSQKVTFHSGGVAFAGGDDTLIVADYGDGASVKIWDIAENQFRTPVGLPRNRKGEIGDDKLAVQSDGHLIAAVGGDPSSFSDFTVKSLLTVWDAKAAKEVASIELNEVVAALAMSPDGGRLAVGDGAGALFRGRLLLIDIGRDKLTINKELEALDWRQSYRFVGFSPDGERLISAANDGRVVIWDLKTNAKRREICLPFGFICGDLAGDGRHLALAYRGGFTCILRLSK
jgi:WD40 repeat protein